MAEERIKVLNMLAAGTINVEQASQLLGILDGDAEGSGRALEAKVKAMPERSASPKEPKFGEFTFDQVLRMENDGVEPAFFAKVRQVGLTNLSFEQVLHMASVGVEPEFVLSARGFGMPNLTFDQIMHLADAGVDSDFLVKVRKAGLADLSFDQIVQMVTAGVEPEFFSRLREASSDR